MKKSIQKYEMIPFMRRAILQINLVKKQMELFSKMIEAKNKKQIKILKDDKRIN